MDKDTRLSILPFPQWFRDGSIELNIVVLPRNQNPLLPAIERHATISDAVPFADAKVSFEARIVSSLAGFPNNLSPATIAPAPVVQPPNVRALFEALKEQFKFEPAGDNASLIDGADKVKPTEFPVRKYLPLSYRRAFNFTTPRTRAAVTDDSYRCAVRGARKVPGFERASDHVSWGQVFAYALRQPRLARELGMIYRTSILVDAALFENGGWLYIDLATDSDFREQQTASEDIFVKKYAARIPP